MGTTMTKQRDELPFPTGSLALRAIPLLPANQAPRALCSPGSLREQPRLGMLRHPPSGVCNPQFSSATITCKFPPPADF